MEGLSAVLWWGVLGIKREWIDNFLAYRKRRRSYSRRCREDVAMLKKQTS